MGLCLGSFLNAVIYRLPRQYSLHSPLWSICPACRHRVKWYDNLPVVSFILLRGRCRNCDVPISTRYLVIETTMALIVLMLLDAFFIGQVRAGLIDSRFGLTDRLWSDWPIFLAHIILFSSLLPMSAIDLEHYWVDVRFTNFAAAAGFVLHTLWTPRHSTEWVRPCDATAVVCLCALIGMGIYWLVLVCQLHDTPEALDDEEVYEPPRPPSPEVKSPRRPPPSLASPSRAVGWVSGLMLLGLFTILLLDEGADMQLRHTGRGLLPLTLFFGLIVWESSVQRVSDQQIIDAIHEERYLARRMVLHEFAHLLPALIGGLLGWWIMHSGENLSGTVSQAVHARVISGDSGPFRHWSPLMGLATAASGYMIAGAVGWAVRIFFTLVFGKEAFGVGDIHLMAAAGCIAGWPIVVIGFFLTCGLALMGWVASLPFKRSRALPLGPWLSLAFLTVTLFYDSILRWPMIERTIDVAGAWFFRN